MEGPGWKVMLTGRLVQQAAEIFFFFSALLSLAHRQQSSSVFDLTETSREENPYSIQALEAKKKNQNPMVVMS